MAQLISREERQGKINAACASLIEFGFPVDLFSVKNILRLGYTEDEFIEFVQPISSITDMRELEYLFKEARQSLHYSISTELKKFMYCVNWITNSERGKKIMLALKRSRMSSVESKEMSEADLKIGHMIVKSVASRKQRCRQISSEIQQLRKRQEDLEIESERFYSESKEEFGPFWGYNELPIFELRLQCYELYLEDCKSKGIDALPIDELGFDVLLESFGSIVKERHVLEFLKEPIMKAPFQNYFREKFTSLAVDGVDMKYVGGGNWVIADSEVSDGIYIPGVKATHGKKATEDGEKAKEGVSEDEKAKETVPDGEKAKEGVSEDEKAKETVPDDEKAKEGVSEDEKAKETVPDDEKAKEGVSGDEKAKETVPDDEKAKETVPDDEKVKGI